MRSSSSTANKARRIGSASSAGVRSKRTGGEEAIERELAFARLVEEELERRRSKS